VEEIDIWRTAHVLMTQHGHEAGMFAAKRAQELRVQGDLDGCAAWISIWRSIDALRVRNRARARR